nr:MAG TPA: hypothetical protein [Caudoviricetes sp.]
MATIDKFGIIALYYDTEKALFNNCEIYCLGDNGKVKYYLCARECAQRKGKRTHHGRRS